MFSRIVTSSVVRRCPLAATSRLVVQQQQQLHHQSMYLTTASASSTQAHLIVNAVGKDRLGIVSDITKHVTDVGGNVGESQATKLGSYFSLMMIIDIPADKKIALEQELQNLNGMNTAIFETEAKSESDYTPKIAYSGRFELEGANHPGIVHKVTSFLAQHGLSVDKLETSDEIAPHGGTTLFKMKGVANALEPLAAGFNAEDIKDKLNKLGDDLNCDVEMVDNK